jgi:hypothetical protein
MPSSAAAAIARVIENPNMRPRIVVNAPSSFQILSVTLSSYLLPAHVSEIAPPHA